MDGAFLTTTSTETLVPLGEAHQRSYELITGVLLDDAGLDEAHAALFAEPRASKYGDQIDWYASTVGRPRRLQDLPEEERALAQEKLDQLNTRIKALSDSYLSEKDINVQSIGEAIANALRYPGPEDVFVVGSGAALQPVIVNWGWVRDTKSAVVGDLSTSVKLPPRVAASPDSAAAAAVAAGAGGPAARSSRASFTPLLWWLVGLGWLLLALMIGAILYLMIEACALRIPGLTGYCPQPGPVASQQIRREQVLRDQIAAVEREIAIADRACQPAPPPAPPVVLPPPSRTEAPALPPLAPPVENNIDQRLQQAGGRSGPLAFTLVWDGTDDLDLSVICPSGVEINWSRSKRSGCGGKLDVDANNKEPLTAQPLENIVFDTTLAGTYQVRVKMYRDRNGTGARDFRLRVNQNGSSQILRGQVSGRDGWTYSHVMER